MPIVSRAQLHYYFLFLYFLVYGSLMAQEKGHFSGLYSIGDYSGEADFAYTIIQNDTVIDGSFLMQKSSPVSILKEGSNSFSFVGTFTEGKADGYWKLQTGNFKTAKAGKVVDYRYQLNLDGIQWQASGEFDSGLLNGEWAIHKNEIENSEITAHLFKSIFNYTEGIPQSSFRIEDEKYSLVGRVLRNGSAHDEWTLYASNAVEAVETWYFDNGVLKKIRFNHQGETIEIPMITAIDKEMTVVPLNQGLLNFLNDIITNKSLAKSEVLKLLVTNDQQYESANNILNAVGEARFNSNIQIKMPFYPLDSLKINKSKAISGKIEKALSMSDSLLTNSHLNIVKRSDPEAAFLIKVADEMVSQYLVPLEKFKTYQQQNLLQFIDRGALISHLWPNGIPSKTIDVDGIEPYLAPNASEYDFSDADSLSIIDAISAYALHGLEHINSTLANHISEGKRIQSFAELEKSLLTKSNELEETIGQQLDTLPQAHQDALRAIKIVADGQLKAYSEMSGESNKTEFGKKMQTCFDDLDKLAEIVVSQPEEWSRIQELYTDQVWNPFMATIMDELQKRKITSAYNDVLVPHFLNQIKDKLDCDSVKWIVEQMQSTSKRMQQLREEETRKLERKLRKERNPMTVLELFNIQTANTK